VYTSVYTPVVGVGGMRGLRAGETFSCARICSQEICEWEEVRGKEARESLRGLCSGWVSVRVRNYRSAMMLRLTILWVMTQGESVGYPVSKGTISATEKQQHPTSILECTHTQAVQLRIQPRRNR
jgi:hypothetical protein